MTDGGLRLATTPGRTVLATTVLGSAVAMLTATVVNVALPTLARDLSASSAEQQWLVNIYMLPVASLILIGGSLGDRYGRLRVYRIGIVWFAVASLACALAPNTEVLLICRFAQGIGAALLTPGSLAIIEATFHPDDRGRAIGLWSGLGGIAGAIGPLVGGLLVEISWRWVFVVNLPLAVVVLAMSAAVPESRDPSAEGRPIDGVGAVLTALFLGGLSYALIDGPTTPRTIAGVAAAVALVVLVIYEPRQPHAILPFDLFRNSTFAAANAVTLLVYGGMGIIFFLLTIQLQVAVGWSPLAAGTALLPVTALMLALSARAGELSRRIGPRLPLTVGPLIMAAAMVWLGRVGPGASYLTDVLPPTVLFGLGLSACVAPVTSAALGSVPDTRAGAASGTNTAVARTGQLLSVAAIPPLVGLTGDALGDPVAIDDGFGPAMTIAAAIVGAGGLLAAIVLPGKPPHEADGTEGSDGPAEDDDRPTGPDPRAEPASAPFHCPVDGPPVAAVRAGR